MNEAIEVREIGNYRISIYNDLYEPCPCTDWDMSACYLWEYNDSHRLSVNCNWEKVHGTRGTYKHSLEDALRELISDNVDFDDLFEYFKNDKVPGYSLEHKENTWYFKEHNNSKGEGCVGYYCLFYFNDSDVESGYDMTDEFIAALGREDLIQILNDLGNDIVVKKWSTKGKYQCDYVEGVAYCTKERYIQMFNSNTDNWKEKVCQIIDSEANDIGMWMWGDVKGFVLEHKENYIKYFQDSEREPENGHDWIEIDSAWGYYMTTEELIEEVISEHGLNKSSTEC